MIRQEDPTKIAILSPIPEEYCVDDVRQLLIDGLHSVHFVL
jgi:hypothetical protein